jgi:hypothetical protein
MMDEYLVCGYKIDKHKWMYFSEGFLALHIGVFPIWTYIRNMRQYMSVSAFAPDGTLWGRHLLLLAGANETN